MTVSTLEALGVEINAAMDIGDATCRHVAQIEFKVAVVVGVELGGKVDVGCRRVRGHDRGGG